MNEDERVRRREFPAITRLTQIGRLLVALQIAHLSPTTATCRPASIERRLAKCWNVLGPDPHGGR
jgi:hypothetical protein